MAKNQEAGTLRSFWLEIRSALAGSQGPLLKRKLLLLLIWLSVAGLGQMKTFWLSHSPFPIAKRENLRSRTLFESGIS